MRFVGRNIGVDVGAIIGLYEEGTVLPFPMLNLTIPFRPITDVSKVE
ncbi:MAG: hypothetical protein AAGI23_16345 [Bacteroidota bacterium]